jgi:hypothetical protein
MIVANFVDMLFTGSVDISSSSSTRPKQHRQAAELIGSSQAAMRCKLIGIGARLEKHQILLIRPAGQRE